ncbi:Golgi transport complex subunit 5 [Rhizoctonia solani]|uniref:Conserved oligomeric Golgi complex subunit 5 n=1 Tax=Rhizoctonia solani TaxID=456999 RepID=A0A8H7M1W8_9AGAM|nr:Golgi transport complex subunit 5 [Rhizoctonia solani]
MAHLHKLKSRGVEVVTCDFENLEQVTLALRGAYAVYGVTNFWEHGEEAEIQQGKNLADAAKACGVRHFIWPSLPHVPIIEPRHWETKITVESYLNEIGSVNPFFFENLWRVLPVTKLPNGTLCLDWFWPSETLVPSFAAEDIGAWVSAGMNLPNPVQTLIWPAQVMVALRNPKIWIGQRLGICVQRLTPRDYASALSEGLRTKVTLREVSVAQFDAVRPYVHDDLWLNMSGSPRSLADAIEPCRKLNPGAQNLTQYIENHRHQIYEAIVAVRKPPQSRASLGMNQIERALVPKRKRQALASILFAIPYVSSMMSEWAEREFGSDTFDPTEYAHKVLAAPTGSTANEDISQLIGRLTLAVDDVAGQIRSLVVAHHEALLTQAANVSGMEGLLSSVRQGINELTQSLDRLRLKVHVPYETLAGLFFRLQKLRQAADVLRRTSRFVALARRLELQMKEIESGISASTSSKHVTSGNSRESIDSTAPGSGAGAEDGNAKERAVARAALSVAELSSLLETSAPTNATANHPTEKSDDQAAFIPLQKINVVARLVPTLDSSRNRINEEMESMINQSVLAAALQTAFNLRIMPGVVQSLLVDLTEAVDARIKSAFDVSRIAKEISGNDPPQPSGLMYRSRVRTAPTNLTAPQWTNALWARLEQMIEEMAGCCIKVYNLEKVLKHKKDPISQTSFLDEAMTATFWSALARSLDKHSKEAAKGISLSLPITILEASTIPIILRRDSLISPETVIVLRSVSAFEQLYLSRSTARMNETIATAVRQSPPGAPEGLAISRTVVNELDSARFDPLLVKSVAKNVGGALELLIVRDRSATSLVGPLGTAQQALNAQIFTMLHTCWARLNKLEGEFHEGVTLVLKPPIKKIERQCEGISEPLLSAIRRDLGLILSRMHRVDFSKSFETMAPGMGGGASAYMKELTAKLGFLRNEVFSKFSVADVVQDWIISVAKNVIRTFVLNASIIKPLGEAGKLQLTSDMTELEFTLGSFVADPSRRTGSLDVLGDDYRVLRALRPLLFLDTALLSSPDDTYSLPPLIILHHIIVRSPYPLPHTLHTWTEAEYVRWIEDHTPREALALVEACVPKWETQTVETNNTDEDWVTLVRAVLRRAVSREIMVHPDEPSGQKYVEPNDDCTMRKTPYLISLAVALAVMSVTIVSNAVPKLLRVPNPNGSHDLSYTGLYERCDLRQTTPAPPYNPKNPDPTLPLPPNTPHRPPPEPQSVSDMRFYEFIPDRAIPPITDPTRPENPTPSPPPENELPEKKKKQPRYKCKPFPSRAAVITMMSIVLEVVVLLVLFVVSFRFSTRARRRGAWKVIGALTGLQVALQILTMAIVVHLRRTRPRWFHDNTEYGASFILLVIAWSVGFLLMVGLVGTGFAARAGHKWAAGKRGYYPIPDAH